MADRSEQLYNDALLLMKSNDIGLLMSAVDYFNSVQGYKDADKKKAKCLEKIRKIELQMEKDRKYMKANIVIICMTMIAILALLTVFISAMIYQHNNVREFTNNPPVTAAVTEADETEPLESGSDTISDNEAAVDTEESITVE